MVAGIACELITRPSAQPSLFRNQTLEEEKVIERDHRTIGRGLERDAMLPLVPHVRTDVGRHLGVAHGEEGSTEKDQRKGRGGAGEVRREPVRHSRITFSNLRPHSPQSNFRDATTSGAAVSFFPQLVNYPRSLDTVGVPGVIFATHYRVNPVVLQHHRQSDNHHHQHHDQNCFPLRKA